MNISRGAGLAPDIREALHRVMPILFGAVQGQVISAAAQLRIADVLEDGPLALSTLAKATHTRPDALERVLHALVCLGLMERLETGEFRCTGPGELLRQNHPCTVRHYALMNNTEWILRVESRLVESLTTGMSAFPSVYGTDCYSFLQEHPEEGEVFNAALTELSAQDFVALKSEFDFNRFRHIVDIGGGEGFLVKALLDDHDYLEATLFDLPDVVSCAEVTLKHHIESGRCRMVGGDFRQQVPAGGDLYILKRMISTCATEDVPILLKRIRRVMPSNGVLLVADPDPASLYGALFDVLMLAVVGGALQSEEDLVAVLSDSGFAVNRSSSTSATLRLVEAEPA